MEWLAEEEWGALAAAHVAQVDRWVRPHRERRRVGEKHPVEDFLFEYYSFRPGQLRRWHPGPDVGLIGTPAAHHREPDYVRVVGGVALDVGAVVARRGDTVRWVRDLLAATAGRPAHLGCFGMHEWAMVYRQDAPDVRHPAWPLRLGVDGTAAVLEERGVRCSHFDAFRFFTESARPLNVLQPRRETQIDLEQPGCLHATMDLYKWAYKLTPLVPSELLLDCFRLARDVRALDMRASPYDLAALGYAPVRVETPDGRAEYVAAQREFARRGGVLRGRLLEVCDRVLTVRTGA